VLGAVLLSISYALAMFSRSAGTVLVIALAASFHADIAEVAAVVTVFFWVYAALQLPAGMLADMLGSRRLGALGAVTAAVGWLCFTTAHSVGSAMLARGVVAAGCAVVFVSMIRHVRTHWAERRVATITGRCILVGNLGAIASIGPLSWLLGRADWRTVSTAIGVMSFAVAAWLWLAIDPPAAPARTRWRIDAIVAELRSVAGNRHSQLGLFLMGGLAGSYYGLASLWLMPMLGARGVPAQAVALQASLLIAGFAAGACTLGWVGDRNGRRGTLSVACAGSVLCWSLLAGNALMGGAPLAALLFALGFCSGGFNLVYALVTERNELAHAGTATAFVNVGIFVGAGIVQSVSTRLYVASHGDFAVVLQPMLVGSIVALLLSLTLFRPSTDAGRVWPVQRPWRRSP
jgi:MFS family permease